MPTSFITTTFVSIVMLNNFGELAPVDKAVLPPGTTGIVWSVEQCRYTIGKMEHPEKYTCQVFTSPKTTAWTPGEMAQPQGTEPDIKADPTSVISPNAIPRAPGASPVDIQVKQDPVKEAPKPKKVAQRPRQTQTAMAEPAAKAAMFNGNPFAGLFNW